MGATFDGDLNVVDFRNSTSTLLGPLETFVGEFVSVTNYSSITVSCKADVDSTFSGLTIDWSTDGITADLAPQQFTFESSLIGFTVHATIRAKFFRVSYQNSVDPQTSFVLTTLLRKGTPSGTVRSVDPANTSTVNLDVEAVQAILAGVGRYNPQTVVLPYMDDVNFTVSNREAYIFVSPRPGKIDNVFRKSVDASLTPVVITSDSFTFERLTFFSITNRVDRGNLYLRLHDSTDLSTTNYDYKIPPGHTYQDAGQFGTVYPGEIWGLWDEVYIESPSGLPGKALAVGHFYG